MRVQRLKELLIQMTDEDAKTRAEAEANLINHNPSEAAVIKIAFDKKNGLNIRVAAYNWLTNRIYVYPEQVNTPGFTIRLPDWPSFIRLPTHKDLHVVALNNWTAFIKTSPQNGLNSWNRIEKDFPTLNEASLAITNSNTCHNGSITYVRDLDPIEHDYSVTISFINMLNNLLISRHSELQSPQIQHSVILDTCLKLVTNLVFLKVDSRQFDKTEEKWTILNLCIQSYYLILSGYEPAKNGNAKSSFKLMSQILLDGELFNCIFMHLENAIDQLTSDLISYSKSTIDKEKVYEPNQLLDEHISLVLLLLNCVAEKQDDFLKFVLDIPDHPAATNIKSDSRLDVANPRTGSVDRLATLMKILAVTSDKTSAQASDLLRRIKGDTKKRIAILKLIMETDRGSQTSSRVSHKNMVNDLGPKGMKRMKTEDGNMVVAIDLSQFRPEEVSVKFCDDNLVVEAKTESAENDFHHETELKRRIRLTSDVNYEAIKSTFTPDAKLLVEMPMNKPRSRSFEIPINIQKPPVVEDKKQQGDQDQQEQRQTQAKE